MFSGSPKVIVAALDNLFHLWRQILVDGANIPLETYTYTCPHGNEIRLDGLDLRGRLLLSITSYFARLYLQYLTLRESKNGGFIPKDHQKAFPKAFRIAEFLRFIPEDLAIPDSRRTQLRLQAAAFLSAMVSFRLVRLFRMMEAPHLAGHFESIAHQDLRDLFPTCFGKEGHYESMMARRLFGTILELAQHAYSDIPEPNKEHRLGAFSSIRLDELSQLTQRDHKVERRYGMKHVEKVFEHQLALIFQSFGLYVVATQTARSTVDLVCISASPVEPHTFMAEAKTTRAAYSLPKKDSRALRDYIQDLKRSLWSFPPLSFVLIIGSRPSRTLETKLAQLEAGARLPIRFIRAQQLADLRERIPGPLPLGIFVKELLTAPRVADGTWVDRIVQAYEAEQGAHRDFVATMLAARGVLPGLPNEQGVKHEECMIQGRGHRGNQ